MFCVWLKLMAWRGNSKFHQRTDRRTYKDNGQRVSFQLRQNKILVNNTAYGTGNKSDSKANCLKSDLKVLSLFNKTKFLIGKSYINKTRIKCHKNILL